jgi:glutamate dehydrogenase
MEPDQASDVPVAENGDDPSTGAVQAFEAILFGRVPSEDLSSYGEEIRVQLAREALAHLARRRPGEPDVRLSDFAFDVGERRRELTLLEVINDDRPFLLDSTLAELTARAIEPRLVAHPIVAVEREAGGALRRLVGEVTSARGSEVAPADDRESVIHVHLPRIEDAGARAELVEALERIYADVATATGDAEAMRRQLADLASDYRANPPPIERDEVGEATAFLDWLDDDHFTLLGMRAYRLPEDEVASIPVEGSGLGLLRDPDIQVLKRGRELVAITPEIRAFLELPQTFIITKASVRSRVHRRVHLDYVGAKLFSPSGRLWGELAIVGLFTPAAYTLPAASIPYLRRKVERVAARAGFVPESHAGRAIVQVLEEFPRDELFQIDEEMLFAFALELMQLSEHPRIRVLTRPDQFDRFVSIIVYIPKERYDSNVRRMVGDFLARLYGGRVSAAYPAYPEGPLARTHFIIGLDEAPLREVTQAELERGIAAVTRTWADKLAEALEATAAGPRARELASRYTGAFGAAYRESFDAETAIADIGLLEQLSDGRSRAVVLYRREGDRASRVNLKLFARGEALPLSERVPLLEKLGFRVLDERTFAVSPGGVRDGTRIWLHDMALERASGAEIDIESVRSRLEAALLAIFRGLAESDGFNKLVLEAGLGWRDAALVRTFGRYLRQIGILFGMEYVADVLARHGEIVAEIIALFYARFELGTETLAARAERTTGYRDRIATMLDAVASLDDDRILRRVLNLVEATLRTNYFQLGPHGLPVETIALKFDCAQVDGLPPPRPLYEIFMNSARVEALHLRFGKVARGGLRWSDRPQDFRTEILGLVKAQQVKNAVIVPVGAKGGFFPKRLPPASDRAAWLAEGTESYQEFVRTLLDLTDNIDGDHIVPAPDVVRYDDDDPYLVVAADKGTATFSDVANAISLEKHHWLGDAFASGGSHGYDHKAMGITARGAWEAVKRHFRELDIDIQSEPVTVVGVGDMSGDVFGNGMLLSRTMRLVAAFDHRDIFLDPEPDVELAFAERERLFRLPRSSWGDYDRALISEGGGVFSRSLKTIPLSPHVQAALGTDRAEADPAELIRLILRAPVGLLWFGGIGTYIRSSQETDLAVGDRANDSVRITGGEIRAKVVGEGANLGATQRGRIEAAQNGVRLNTDAIDNSAGVNTSDVEVNIKIALATPERDGRLTFEARNALLAEMTDEVGALVLRNNYLQTLALSLTERRGRDELGFLARLMDVLEQEGRLDRPLEFLPDKAALADRAKTGQALTRPELSVLLAYAKLALNDALLASDVPDDPYLARELERYFPAPLRERFPDAIAGHRLRREIIATQLANAIINRLGPSIVVRLADDAGADAATVATAYAATRDSFGLSELYAAIDALDGAVSGALQLTLYGIVQDLAVNRMVWFIRNVDFSTGKLDDVVGLYRVGIQEVGAALAAVLPARAVEAVRTRSEALFLQGVPETLAGRIAALPDIAAAPDIVLVSRRSNRSVEEVARAHFALDDMLHMAELSASAGGIPVSDHYDRLARDRAVDTVATAHRRLTAEVVAREEPGEAALAAWTAARSGEVDRIRRAVDAITSSGLTVSKLTVAANLLGDLAKA